MIVLGLDLSSHSGWAVLNNHSLIACGVLNISTKNQDFPWGILCWSNQCVDQIIRLYEKYHFVDKIVIEQTNLGRNREYQSFLEWLHCILLKSFCNLNSDKKIEYVSTSQWRKKLNLKLTKEQRKQNKFVLEQHRSGQKNVLQNGHRIGKVTSKHLAIQYVNSKFNLNLKQKYNDIADAICIGLSVFN